VPSDVVSVARSVRLRLSGELWLFVAPRHRREQVEVHHDGTATLGHLVEALGVPLTEVGELLAAGVAVSSAQRPPAGVAVEVWAVRRPQRVSGWSGRFLLDVHLGTLARRLRLLGIDAAYCNDVDDGALIEQAQCQRRLLLTQDRGLLRRRALWAGAYVRGSRPIDQLTDVLERFAPVLAPFTRCTTCNGEVESVRKQEVAPKLQPGTRRCYQAYSEVPMLRTGVLARRTRPSPRRHRRHGSLGARPSRHILRALESRRFYDQRRGCLRGRRHGPRTVTDRVGDANGWAAAARVDAHLTGRDLLPCPIQPTDAPIV
jgi:uncharacterized protein